VVRDWVAEPNDRSAPLPRNGDRGPCADILPRDAQVIVGVTRAGRGYATDSRGSRSNSLYLPDEIRNPHVRSPDDLPLTSEPSDSPTLQPCRRHYNERDLRLAATSTSRPAYLKGALQ
jgi:hypothetical protein